MSYAEEKWGIEQLLKKSNDSPITSILPKITGMLHVIQTPVTLEYSGRSGIMLLYFSRIGDQNMVNLGNITIDGKAIYTPGSNEYFSESQLFGVIPLWFRESISVTRHRGYVTAITLFLDSTEA